MSAIAETAVPEAQPAELFVLPHRDHSGLRARLNDQVMPDARPIDVELRAAMLAREVEGPRGRHPQVRVEAGHGHERVSVTHRRVRSSAIETLDLTGRSLQLR